MSERYTATRSVLLHKFFFHIHRRSKKSEKNAKVTEATLIRLQEVASFDVYESKCLRKSDWVDLMNSNSLPIISLRAVNKRSDCILPPAGKGGLLEVVAFPSLQSFLCMGRI